MAKRIITINRMFGSNGRLIGKTLAENLDIGFYDKELIDMAAKKNNIPFDTLAKVDEKKGNLSKTIVSTGNLDLAENALTELLMERFEQDEDAFSIVDQSEIMEAMSGVTNTMSLMIRTNRVFLSGNPHIDKV